MHHHLSVPCEGGLEIYRKYLYKSSSIFRCHFEFCFFPIETHLDRRPDHFAKRAHLVVVVGDQMAVPVCGIQSQYIMI